MIVCDCGIWLDNGIEITLERVMEVMLQGIDIRGLTLDALEAALREQKGHVDMSTQNVTNLKREIETRKNRDLQINKERFDAILAMRSQIEKLAQDHDEAIGRLEHNVVFCERCLNTKDLDITPGRLRGFTGWPCQCQCGWETATARNY